MKTRGFTLVEIVIFIVVIGIVYSGIVVFYFELLKRSDDIKTMAKLQTFAEQRMELIVGRKKAVGTLSFTDPCSANPSILPCSLASNEGYVVTSNLPLSGSESAVTVTASKYGFNFQLKTIVAEY